MGAVATFWEMRMLKKSRESWRVEEGEERKGGELQRVEELGTANLNKQFYQPLKEVLVSCEILGKVWSPSSLQGNSA